MFLFLGTLTSIIRTGQPINSKRDALFHCMAYEYSRADLDGLRDHLRDVSWEDIFKLSASAAVTEFCEWIQVGIDIYISLIVSIRSNLTYLHGFQQLVLRPQFIEIIFFLFVCLYLILEKFSVSLNNIFEITWEGILFFSLPHSWLYFWLFLMHHS